MKKIIVFFLCVMVATASLFAAGGKEREMTIFGGYQGNFYNYNYNFPINSYSAQISSFR